MKRIFVCSFLLLFSGFAKISIGQISPTTFWYETFGLGPCNQGGLPGAPTPSNGAWTTVNLGVNGPQSNAWFMSATEAGRPLGNCGDGCLNNAGFTNKTLHISSNIAPPFTDPGAAYLQNNNSATDKRVESPVINCTGKNNIVFSFNYIANGVPGTDFAEALYSDNGGVSYTVLGVLAPSMGTCAPQGLWVAQSYTLPPTADGNANVKVGFRWTNGPAVGPGNLSVAVDELVLASPVVQFTLPAQACINLTFMPTITNSVVPTDSYSWSCSAPNASFTPPTGLPMPVITISTTGVHTITCYAMNLGVLTSSATATVNVVSSLNFTATASPSVLCIGDNAQLTANGSGTAYVWNPGNLPGSPVSVSPTVATVYTVTGNDIAGCAGSGTVLVNMGQAPIINVVVTASAVCPGFTSTLTAGGASTYTWVSTGSPTPAFTSNVVGGPGTYTVVASAPPLPCNAQSVIVIAQGAPLQISVLTSPQTATTCIYKNFTPDSKPVQLCASGAGVYTWTPVSSLNYSIGPCVIARPLVSTCYTVIGNTSVCSGSAIVCVTVIPQYTMDVIPKQPIICIGDSINLKIANIGTTAVQPYSYNWVEPINAPPPSMSNPLASSVTISPTNLSSPATYSAEVIDARGCASAPRLITATVLPQPLTTIGIPTLSGIPTNSICYVGNTTGSNPEATITYSAINMNGLPPEYQPIFQWISPYTPSVTYNPFLTSPFDYTVVLAAPLRTPQVVTYTVQSGFNGIPGCKRFDTISVRVIDCRPLKGAAFYAANIDAPNDTICTRTCVSFVNQTDTMAGGPQTYTWNCVGGTPQYSNLKDPTICYNLPGTYNVVLYVENPYAKPNGSSIFVSKYKYIRVVDVPNPKIVFTPLIQTNPLYHPKDTVIRFGACVALTATNAATYEWSPNYFVSPVTSAHSITVCPQRSQLYVLHGWNSAGCSFVDSLNVTVIEDCGEMFVPTAFSPNGDGANDVLRVRGLCLETLTFMVFNQWGEKVFETNDKEIGWDGTYKGELMNTGVFVYRLEGKTYQGKGFSLKGNVTLIR